ncbi:hypothetical protein P691DRAFT_811522, partial [Macrolepiota fuliginosa MF-IS2]
TLQASKILGDATNTRAVWLGLAKSYTSRNWGCSRPDVGALDTLSADEVRHWIWKRLVIEEIWRQPRARTRTRQLQRANYNAYVMALVPGGRWLVTGHQHGLVCYYDLDMETLTPVTLVEPIRDDPIPGAWQYVQALEVCVEIGTPTLQFLVAFSGISEHWRPIEWIHVWRVKLEPDNTLKPTRLTSVPCDRLSSTHNLSLTPDIIARTVGGGMNTCVELFWWKECSSTRVLRSVIPVEPPTGYIRILRGNRILYIKIHGGIYIYDYPEPQYTNDLEIPDRHAPPRQAQWSHPLNKHGRVGFSRLFSNAAGYQQVMSTEFGVLGVVIPVSPDDSPCVIKLSKLRHYPTVYGLGLHRGYGASRPGRATRFGYSWDPSGPKTAYRNTWKGNFRVPGGDHRGVDFDEETGRFVYWKMGGNVCLVDFIS